MTEPVHDDTAALDALREAVAKLNVALDLAARRNIAVELSTGETKYLGQSAARSVVTVRATRFRKEIDERL
jgi:hypothetical protein